MAVRNFWLKADVDGRATTASCGPVSKDGGMDIRLYQRENGNSVPVLTVLCREDNGKLKTTVRDREYNVVAEIITER